MKKEIIIYGANGFTAKLFAKQLIKNGVKPILAGRSNKVIDIAKELNLNYRIFSIENAKDYLQDAQFLVNLAGPFSITQSKLITSCIETKTHYLDLAGEYNEVVNAFNFHKQALEAGIVVLTAAGFGVVPTDIAAKLASDLIEAPKNLKIVFATEGGASKGTLKTILKDINKSGKRLINGDYRTAKPAEDESLEVVFSRSIKAVYNPWRADLYTANKSTSINNISTYSEFPGFIVSMMKGKKLWLRNLILNRLLFLFPEGPSEKQLKKGKTYIKAIVSNEKGDCASVELQGPEAYVFTVICLSKMIELISNSELRGAITPSMLGTGWLENFDQINIEKRFIAKAKTN